MRDIKFKIWADDRFYDKCLVGNTNNVEDDKWTCPLVWLEDKKEWVHCDNGIICEFTGLKDKNGKEVYEGDIISNGYEKCIVVWVKEYAGFMLKLINKEYEDKEWTNPMIDLRNDEEVIGNIYESPELLKGADNIE